MRTRITKMSLIATVATMMTSASLASAASSTNGSSPGQLACKIYGEHGSAQLHTETTRETRTGFKTYLVLTQPLAWTNDTVFEIVYTDINSQNGTITIVGLADNSTSTHFSPQAIEIVLDRENRMNTVRYGRVRAGDFNGNSWSQTFGKHKEYKIQCFNF